jgi:CHAT domain-containing protein
MFFLREATAQKNTIQLQAEVDSISLISKHLYELGDYKSALNLNEAAYSLERSYLPQNHPALLQRLASLAISYADIKNIEKARSYIDTLSSKASENPIHYYDSLYALTKFAKGKVYESEENLKLAAKAYKSYILHTKNNTKLKASENHINRILSIGIFYYFRMLNTDEGGYYAKLAHGYSQHPKFDDSLVKLRALNFIAYYYFANNLFKEDEKFLKYIQEAKTLAEEIRKQSPSNAIKTLRYERQFTLWKTGLEFVEDRTPSAESLANWSREMGEAIESWVGEKSILRNTQDVNLNFLSASDYFNFSKNLNWKAYKKSGSEESLDALVSLHESFLYSKIRTRLKNKKIDFNDVPSQVSERENDLLQKLFLQPKSTAKSSEYSIEDWYSFLDSLKTDYPKYHNLKYGKIVQSVGDLQKQLPKETTLIRYFYIYGRLHAFICNANEKTIVQLPYINIDLYLDKYEKSSSSDIQLAVLNVLYNKLWKPFEDNVKTENIIIIPDGNLFNLSFELLTPSQLDSYKQLAEQALIAKHNISYNYSTYLLEATTKILEFKGDFIAFAPEFNDEMKRDYTLAIADSASHDKTYISLLRQPFSSKLVSKVTREFSGNSFLNEKASKQLFTQTAKEHKIIHIGTHAESNNVNPELSRLVFAKNVADSTSINDNYLYSYEIYNLDLSSNLAILTACETGKPTHQPGEGMISLAHAFNYAGSESILTSLWQIDEQSSTQILEYFYSNLEDGFRKDEALKKAKLDYLSKAEGRTLHPQYWAGLILMGDTAPIELSTSNNWFWISTVCLVAIITLFIFYKKFSFSESSENIP